MKRGEEKRREEKKNKSRYGIVCMNFCMDTCFGVWNISFCVESLFGMVVWFGCSPQWKKNLYRENVRF